MGDPRDILERSKTVAVVGMSTNPEKPAHAVPKELKEAGFKVIPVNPSAAEILGERAVRRVADIQESVDVVEVFRPSEEAPDIARQAVEAGARALWLQLGITSEEARKIAEDAGIDYVEDRCMGVERGRFGIRKDESREQEG